MCIGSVNTEARETPEVNLLVSVLKSVEIVPTLITLKLGETSVDPPAEPHVLYFMVGPHRPVMSIADHE